MGSEPMSDTDRLGDEVEQAREDSLDLEFTREGRRCRVSFETDDEDQLIRTEEILTESGWVEAKVDEIGRASCRERVLVTV